MPLYDTECSACGHRFERIQKFSDPPVEECPNCGKKSIQKLMSSPAIQFKGSGWYITDYAEEIVGERVGERVERRKSRSERVEESEESKESRESRKSKESTESKASKVRPRARPPSGTPSTPKASGE